MLRIGDINNLDVSRLHPSGAFLDGGELGEVLLPQRFVPGLCKPGDRLEVFVYTDSDQQLLATTQYPLARVGQVAWLKVVDVNNTGAFLDWGLPKNLLVPYGEQVKRMVAGRSYLVMIFLDEKNRVTASSRLNQFVHDENNGLFLPGQEVSIVIADKTDLGFKAVVNNTHWGVLYENELFQNVQEGQQINAHIKNIRGDDKLDLSLQKPGYSKDRVSDLTSRIVEQLKREGGFLELHDKSSPELIYDTFGVSKKNFKQAIGQLYKEKIIIIGDDGLHLISDAS